MHTPHSRTKTISDAAVNVLIASLACITWEPTQLSVWPRALMGGSLHSNTTTRDLTGGAVHVYQIVLSAHHQARARCAITGLF